MSIYGLCFLGCWLLTSCGTMDGGSCSPNSSQCVYPFCTQRFEADFNSSALAEHAWTCDHAVDWSNVKVLSNPRDYTTRMLEEAVFIRQTRDTLNRDCGSLPAEYENLFEKGLTLADPSLS